MSGGPSGIRFADIDVRAQDVLATPWLDALPEPKPDQLALYLSPLAAAMDRADKANDRTAYQVHLLLYALASLHYTPDDADEPYKPGLVGAGGRSAALSDFGERHVAVISAVYSQIPDAEMQARMADLVWVRTRDHIAGRAAVQAYLARAKAVMDPTEWCHGYDCLQRALQVATELDKRGNERAEAIEYALTVVRSLAGKDDRYLTHKLVELLLHHRAAPASDLAALAEASAVGAEARSDWHAASDHWPLVRACHHRASNGDGARDAQRRHGEALLHAAEESATQARWMVAAHWQELAFAALRAASVGRDRLNEVACRLSELQSLSLSEMRAIEVSVPLDEPLRQQIEAVRGMGFHEALRTWAGHSRITRERLRGLVQSVREAAPTASLFPTTLVGDGGRADCLLPPLGSDIDADPTLLDQHMWHALAGLAGFFLARVCEPIRGIIQAEHPWQDGCLDWLLAENPFVPADRAAIYSRALQAGLAGDYLVCMHLLIPQLEHSFRHVMSQHGVNAVFARQDGTQDVRPMIAVFDLPEFRVVFGEDVAFELRGLLVERAGANLRNDLCHGLLAPEACESPAACVLVPLTVLVLLAGWYGAANETEAGLAPAE